MKHHPQTIEATSKRYKGGMALGILAILVAAGWWAAAATTGGDTSRPFVLMGFGFGSYLTSRFAAWWANG